MQHYCGNSWLIHTVHITEESKGSVGFRYSLKGIHFLFLCGSLGALTQDGFPLVDTVSVSFWASHPYPGPSGKQKASLLQPSYRSAGLHYSQVKVDHVSIRDNCWARSCGIIWLGFCPSESSFKDGSGLQNPWSASLKMGVGVEQVLRDSNCVDYGG